VRVDRRRWMAPGIPLMQQYKERGLDMLWEHSQFEDASVSVEARLMQ
jgi:hypothetical protein